MKRCTGCGNSKLLSEYWTNKMGKDGKQPKCKSCLLEQQRTRRKTVGDNTTYRYRYGKTVEELNTIREEQGNCCAICKEKFTESFHTVVDHDHKTNQFRGLLCRRCNSGLGMFRDNKDYLQEAIKYLST